MIVQFQRRLRLTFDEPSCREGGKMLLQHEVLVLVKASSQRGVSQTLCPGREGLATILTARLRVMGHIGLGRMASCNRMNYLPCPSLPARGPGG